MLTLAFRNLFRHLGRTLLSLAAIVFGVAGLALSGGFVEDVFIQLREATIHSQLGHLQLYRTGYAEQGRQRPFSYLIDDAQSIADRIRQWPGVADAMRRVDFSALASNGSADLPIVAQGVEPDKEAQLGSFMVITEGKQLTSDDEYGITLGEGVAKSLQLAPGDPLTLLATTEDGELNSVELTVIGVFRSFSKEFDDRAVRLPLTTAQELLLTDRVHSIVVSLGDTAHTQSLAERLKPQAAQAGLELRTWRELADFYQQTEELYRTQFGVLQLIILVMVILSVANSINMAIYERTGEFGTQMAIGDRRDKVFRLILVENAILGFIGAELGVLLAMVLAWAIGQIGIPMPPPPNSNAGYTAFIRLTPGLVVTSFLVGLAATVFAAVLPARRASRLHVVDAIRHSI